MFWPFPAGKNPPIIPFLLMTMQKTPVLSKCSAHFQLKWPYLFNFRPASWTCINFPFDGKVLVARGHVHLTCFIQCLARCYISVSFCSLTGTDIHPSRPTWMKSSLISLPLPWHIASRAYQHDSVSHGILIRFMLLSPPLEMGCCLTYFHSPAVFILVLVIQPLNAGQLDKWKLLLG